jgi:hypothetical protein
MTGEFELHQPIAMENYPSTPPNTHPHTPNSKPTEEAPFKGVSPTSQNSATSNPTPEKLIIPQNLTQALVNADPQLKRFQQDLLVLTSFNENETLHWRPSWFTQTPYNECFWTLYNPPNVVTEQLPHTAKGRVVYTRRMRRPDDAAPVFIKTWEAWYRVCELRGVPSNFLSEEQVELMRLGLPRDGKGLICGESIVLLDMISIDWSNLYSTTNKASIS